MIKLLRKLILRHCQKDLASAFNLGVQFGKHLSARAEGLAEQRLDPAFRELLTEFREQLNHVFDDDRDPDLAATIELEIFRARANVAVKQAWEDTQELLKNDLRSMSQMPGIGSAAAGIVRNTISNRVQNLINDVSTEYAEKLGKVHHRQD